MPLGFYNEGEFFLFKSALFFKQYFLKKSIHGWSHGCHQGKQMLEKSRNQPVFSGENSTAVWQSLDSGTI